MFCNRIVLLTLVTCSLDGICGKEFGLLQDSLLSNYSTAIKPRRNAGDPVYVNITLHAHFIYQLDERLQHFSFMGWLEVVWFDEFLIWNETEYGGLKFINLPTLKVWIPDISMYNKEGYPQDIGKGDFVCVSSNGILYWYPGGQYTVECTVDITRFPVDDQKCSVTIGPWQTTDWTQILVPVLDTISTYSFSENGEWELVKTEAIATKNIPFNMTNIRYIFYLKRRSLYALLSYTLPLVLLSFLNSIVFCLPTSSGEKLTLSISVFLSFTVFLTIFQQMMPKKSTEIPYLSIYLSFQLIMSVLSILATVYVWRLEDKAKECKRNNYGNKRHGTDECMNYSKTVKYSQNTKLSQKSKSDTLCSKVSCIAEKITMMDDLFELQSRPSDDLNHNEMNQTNLSLVYDFPKISKGNIMNDSERYNAKAKRMDKVFFIISFIILFVSTLALSASLVV